VCILSLHLEVQYIFHSVPFRSIPLHYIPLHYITLHYITLHYITLHYIKLFLQVTHGSWSVFKIICLPVSSQHFSNKWCLEKTPTRSAIFVWLIIPAWIWRRQERYRDLTSVALPIISAVNFVCNILYQYYWGFFKWRQSDSFNTQAKV
jgi:hypothetical protein